MVEFIRLVAEYWQGDDDKEEEEKDVEVNVQDIGGGKTESHSICQILQRKWLIHG